MKQIYFKFNGWLLKDGQVVPYEFKNGNILRWKQTNYFKRGLKLLNLEQDFYVSSLNERVS